MIRLYGRFNASDKLADSVTRMFIETRSPIRGGKELTRVAGNTCTQTVRRVSRVLKVKMRWVISGLVCLILLKSKIRSNWNAWHCMLSIESWVQMRESFQVEMSFENGPNRRIQMVNGIDVQESDFGRLRREQRCWMQQLGRSECQQQKSAEYPHQQNA